MLGDQANPKIGRLHDHKPYSYQGAWTINLFEFLGSPRNRNSRKLKTPRSHSRRKRPANALSLNPKP